MSLGLAVFHTLCEAGNALAAYREEVTLPGSDAWVALTEMLDTIDRCIDMLVESPALEKHDVP